MIHRADLISRFFIPLATKRQRSKIAKCKVDKIKSKGEKKGGRTKKLRYLSPLICTYYTQSIARMRRI